MRRGGRRRSGELQKVGDEKGARYRRQRLPLVWGGVVLGDGWLDSKCSQDEVGFIVCWPAGDGPISPGCHVAPYTLNLTNHMDFEFHEKQHISKKTFARNRV